MRVFELPHLPSRLTLRLAGWALFASLWAASCRGTQDPRPGTHPDDDGSNSDTTSAGGRSGSGGSGDMGGGGGEISLGGADAVDVCGEAPNTTADFTKAALLNAAADCSVFHTCRFGQAAVDLEREVSAYADSGSDGALARARVAWLQAMEVWSTLEGFQIGPIADGPVDTYHGRSIRTLVHPWPNTNRCNVEKQVALRVYAGGEGFAKVPASGRGLFALEYLLFTSESETACSSAQEAAVAWNAMSADELDQAKRDYARALGKNVLELSRELIGVWSTTGEDFRSKLLSFEKYGSEQETLNVLAWSLIYPEAEVKDWKIGPSSTIPAIPASVPVETPYARVGVENVRINLLAFKGLFQGCRPDGAGVGFDDWLEAAGASDLRDEMLAAYEQAQNAADAFPAFEDATTADFNAFYGDIKPLADLLKSSFFGSGSPLNLKLPASAASDTD